jgi:hypothetical protein
VPNNFSHFNPIGTIFKGTDIAKFNELKYFPLITDIPDFAGCSKLTEANFDNIKELNKDGCFQHTNITYMYFPAVVNARMFYSFINAHTRGVRFGNNLKTLYDIFELGAPEYCIIGSLLPPIMNRAAFVAKRYYIPDSVVESYKTAPVWKNMSDKIYPFSQFAKDFPHEPERMYEPL